MRGAFTILIKFYEKESDKTVVFSVGAYLFLGASLQVTLAVKGFFAEADRILGDSNEKTKIKETIYRMGSLASNFAGCL